MTDLSAGPEVWGHKVNEPDTSGQYPDPAARKERIAELEQEFNGLPHSATARAKQIRAELSRLRNEQPKGGDDDPPCPHCGTFGWGSDHASDCPANPVPGYSTGTLAECRPSPSPEPQDVREALVKQLNNLRCTGYMRWELPQSLLDDLRAALAQSDAQPVGAGSGDAICWHIQERRNGKLTRGYVEWKREHAEKRLSEPERYEVKPLCYTAPPRPDASGLIEAAEIVEEWAIACSSDRDTHLLTELAVELRSRTADRSVK